MIWALREASGEPSWAEGCAALCPTVRCILHAEEGAEDKVQRQHRQVVEEELGGGEGEVGIMHQLRPHPEHAARACTL